MFKKNIGLVMLLSLLSTVAAADVNSECEAAVDSADRLNADSHKNCDYSSTGLNGVLHKAFAKNKGSEQPSTPAAIAEPNSKLLVKTLAGEFESAQQLTTLRYALLLQAAQHCSSGFSLNSEQYLPLGATRLQLVLRYHCL